jgi:preprotein translocase subunit SecG
LQIVRPAGWWLSVNFHLPIVVQAVRSPFPMSALYIILLIGIVLVSLFLLLLVLMQRPKQEGLGATFGVDATNQMFGSRTTDVLQKATTYLTVVFFLLAVGLGLLNAHETKKAARLGTDLASLPVPELPAATPPPADAGAPGDLPGIPAAPALEAPALEVPALEVPAIEAPALETPALETPALEAPALETPALETPALETPALEAPAAEAPSSLGN